MMAGRRIAFEDLVRFDGALLAPPVALVAGVDEAGRGALAGPVVAAAVICEPCDELRRVRDSKLVCEREREILFGRILERCVAHGVGIVEAGEIDRINILRATLKAMKIAVESLGASPDLVLVDGNRLPDIPVPAMAIPGGDGRSFSIAAASIVAKVTRDRIMRDSADVYCGYGWRENKGYGTAQHLEAIGRLGRTAFHRRSFRAHA